MIYPVIILIAVICTIITLFLIKESFTSNKKRIFTFTTLITVCITLITAIFTVLYSFKESEYGLENNIYDLQNKIESLENELSNAEHQLSQYQNSNNTILDNSNEKTNQIYDQPIIFDNVPCFILSKNHDDTVLNNNGTEIIFYNHPEENNTYNTATFSFNLEKYNSFNIKISINDNISNENEIQTTIEFYNEIGEIVFEEKLNNTNPSSHIYIDISGLSKLTIIIKTNMIETDDNLFRTVSFSNINIQ